VSNERTSPERLEAVVRGHVQGVGFRYWVVRRAAGLGLSGWVANQPDGSVRCVAEGSGAALDELERLLNAGPAGSVVDHVQAVRMPGADAFTGFEVRSGSHAGD
jgi:acylphosphatase